MLKCALISIMCLSVLYFPINYSTGRSFSIIHRINQIMYLKYRIITPKLVSANWLWYCKINASSAFLRWDQTLNLDFNSRSPLSKDYCLLRYSNDSSCFNFRRSVSDLLWIIIHTPNFGWGKQCAYLGGELLCMNVFSLWCSCFQVVWITLEPRNCS